VHDGVGIRNAGKFQTGGVADTLLAIPRVAAVIKEERPDWIFLLGWTTWLFILHLMKPAFGFRLGFICGLDTEVNGGFRRENPVRGLFFEYAMRRCDARFAMTEDQRTLFHKHGMTCGFYRNLILPRAFERTADKSIDLLWVSTLSADQAASPLFGSCSKASGCEVPDGLPSRGCCPVGVGSRARGGDPEPRFYRARPLPRNPGRL